MVTLLPAKKIILKTIVKMFNTIVFKFSSVYTTCYYLVFPMQGLCLLMIIWPLLLTYMRLISTLNKFQCFFHTSTKYRTRLIFPKSIQNDTNLFQQLIFLSHQSLLPHGRFLQQYLGVWQQLCLEYIIHKSISTKHTILFN